MTNTLRLRLHELRASRRRTLALRRDLAGFTSTAELIELSALLRRHSDRDAEPIRRLVDWSAAA